MKGKISFSSVHTKWYKEIKDNVGCGVAQQEEQGLSSDSKRYLLAVFGFVGLSMESSGLQNSNVLFLGLD